MKVRWAWTQDLHYRSHNWQNLLQIWEAFSAYEDLCFMELLSKCCPSSIIRKNKVLIMDQKCNQDSTDKNYTKNFRMANPTKVDTWKIKEEGQYSEAS